jgi:hypothetical protein
VDGVGRTDSGTVVDILAARLEATDAILSGRVEATGEPEAVAAMLLIIEILLDASVRAPVMQLLAREFVAAFVLRSTPHDTPMVAWYPRGITDTELDLLRGLDLLPDGG